MKNNNITYINRRLLPVLTAMGLAVIGTAQAAIVINFEKIGADVRVSANGTLNLDAALQMGVSPENADNAAVGVSGGPLFDLEGNVCGIATGAGDSASSNTHMSSGTFLKQWGDYLLEGKPLPSRKEVKALARQQKNNNEATTKATKDKITKHLKRRFGPNLRCIISAR